MTLLHVDRVLLHDLSGFRALKAIEDMGETVIHPELVVGSPIILLPVIPVTPWPVRLMAGLELNFVSYADDTVSAITT